MHKFEWYKTMTWQVRNNDMQFVLGALKSEWKRRHTQKKWYENSIRHINDTDLMRQNDARITVIQSNDMAHQKQCYTVLTTRISKEWVEGTRYISRLIYKFNETHF